MNAETVIATLLIPLVGVIYLLMKDKIQKVEDSTQRENNYIRNELVFLNQKYISILEQISGKFGAWENSLKNVAKDFREGNDPSESLNDFERESERLKDYFEANVEIVKKDMKKLEKIVRTKDNEITREVTDLFHEMEIELNKMKRTLKISFDVMRVFNNKSKQLERMIGENQKAIKNLENRMKFGRVSLKE